MTTYQRSGKRFFEVVLVLLTSPIWLPLLGLAGLVVRCALGPPVIFRQARPGLNGEVFEILKLRTMDERYDSTGRPLADESRLSKIGRFLRRTSLDELPEVLNVLRGELSLVGPRPLLPQYLDLYTPEQARRHEVRPGITGWAQVNGRNALTWEDRFELDVWYVDHVSFPLDLRIMVMTLWKTLSGEGLSAEGHATMPEFMGTQDE